MTLDIRYAHTRDTKSSIQYTLLALALCATLNHNNFVLVLLDAVLGRDLEIIHQWIALYGIPATTPLGTVPLTQSPYTKQAS